MATSDIQPDAITPLQPLIGGSTPMESAAETMLAASRTMLAAAASLSSATSDTGARRQELTAEAIETGFLRAFRREALLGGMEVSGSGARLLSLPTSRGLPGTGYGRMGAGITGSGARSQLYGTIGGAVGYGLGGPVGAIIGGMLGGLFGGDDDDEAERARQQEELRRQWLNTPEGFEVEAYLYNLARGYAATGSLVSQQMGLPTTGPSWFSSASAQPSFSPIVVNLAAGAVQVNGQSEEAGERAARAFAGSLGRVLRLNSVVVPAAGLGGDV